MGKNLEERTEELVHKTGSIKKLGSDVLSWITSNPTIGGFGVGIPTVIMTYYNLGADSNWDIANGIINGIVAGIGMNITIRVNNLYRELQRKFEKIDWSEFFRDPKTLSLCGAVLYGMSSGELSVVDGVIGGVVGYGFGLVLNDIISVVDYMKDKSKEFKSIIKEKAREGLEWIVNHPIISSVVSNISFFAKTPVYGENLVASMINDPTDAIALPWYLGYIPFAIAKEYGLHRKSRFLIESPEESGFVEKLYYWMLNNPKLVGIVFGITAGLSTAGVFSSSTEQFIGQSVLWSNIFGMSGQLLFNQIRYNKMIGTAMKEQKKPRKEGLKKITNVTDLIFENPLYVGGFVTGAYLTWGITKYSTTSEDLRKYFILPAIVSVVIGATAAFTTSMLGPLLHSQSAKKTQNSMFSHIYSILGFHNKAVDSWEKAMEVPTTSYQQVKDKLHFSNLLIKAGKNYDRVIRQQSEAARILQENELGINHYDLLKSITGIDRLSSKISQISHEIRPRKGKDISLGLALVAEKRYDKGFSILQKLFESDPEDSLINSTYAYALISAGKKEEARRQFQNITRNLDKIADVRDLRPFGGSKAYYIDDPLLHDTFVLKEGKLDALQDEIKLTQKLYKKILSSKYAKSFYKTAEPIDIVPYEDTQYYVTLVERGKLLAEAAKEDINHIKRAAKYQGFIHGIMTEQIVEDNINHKQKIMRRMKENTTIDDELKLLFFKNLDPTIDDGDYLVVDRDGHPYQWIITKKGIVAIDTEDRGFNRDEDDNAKLLFQGNFIPREPSSFDLISDILLNGYLPSRNEVALEELKVKDERERVRKTLRAVPRKAISYYFFASGTPETTDIRNDFLRNGIFTIDLIAEHFSDSYSKTQMQQFGRLQKGLNSLINVSNQ